ncbi:hypothetical protein ON010_g16618 [Phytophthora cinnamomi]|nr:hypothetical protein ON010_g16618 [Phytophthora cinnamomi]
MLGVAVASASARRSAIERMLLLARCAQQKAADASLLTGACLPAPPKFLNARIPTYRRLIYCDSLASTLWRPSRRALTARTMDIHGALDGAMPSV